MAINGTASLGIDMVRWAFVLVAISNLHHQGEIASIHPIRSFHSSLGHCLLCELYKCIDTFLGVGLAAAWGRYEKFEMWVWGGEMRPGDPSQALLPRDAVGGILLIKEVTCHPPPSILPVLKSLDPKNGQLEGRVQ